MGRRKKAKKGGFLSRIFGDWEGNSTFLLVCIIFAFVLVGTIVLWGRFGDLVMSGSQYRLSEASFETTPQPKWIVSSNVTAESIVTGSLAELNIRQKDVTVRVGQAFAMHPWVKRVKHVTKRYPSKILVELEYREPVAMVEVDEKVPGVRPGEIARLPVDIDGILLPTGDFTAEVADGYIRISAGGTCPVSTIAGTYWGDPRVLGAARVAGFLLPYQNRFEIVKVIAYRGPRAGKTPPTNYFVLRNRSGATVIWGRAPGEETAGEPLAEQKVTRLTEFSLQHDGLKRLQPGQTIDLRQADGLHVATLPMDPPQ